MRTDVIAHYMYVDLPVRPCPQCSKPIQKQNPEEHYSRLENLMSAYHRKYNRPTENKVSYRKQNVRQHSWSTCTNFPHIYSSLIACKIWSSFLIYCVRACKRSKNFGDAGVPPH